MSAARLAVLVIALGLVARGCAGAPPDIHVPPPGNMPALETASATGDLALQGPYLPDVQLRVCNMQVSNAPQVDPRGWVIDFTPLILVENRVILAAAPANDVCISSGFGPRYGRPHEGLDLLSQPAATVFSAGPGIVREARTASGYGLQLVIDHGSGVFTRYAHLARLSPGIAEGTEIGFGQPLGLMGRSGNATAIHLHYEVLTGTWGPKRSYGLVAHDPLSFPAYQWQDTGF